MDTQLLTVQKFLLENSIDDLRKNFGIKVKEYSNFIGLNYDQIKSPKSHPITIECRSLILIKDGKWSVASKAFDRFFNYGECADQYAEFDFTHAVITEKVDGSIIPVWYNTIDCRWEISSKSAIFGESQVKRTGKTYRQTVLQTFDVSEDQFQDVFNRTGDKDATYIFEFAGPDNFIVTPYSKNQMVMLGIRYNNFANKYFSVPDMETFVSTLKNDMKNVRMFKTYSFRSFDDILASLNNFKSIEEGYVALDTLHDLRVKIKSPQHVALHHLRGKNATTEGLISVAINGEIDEVVVYFPHLKDRLQKIKDSIQKVIADMNLVYNGISCEEQKNFAKLAKNQKYSALLFSARKNKTSAEQEFNVSTDNYKLKLLTSIIGDL